MFIRDGVHEHRPVGSPSPLRKVSIYNESLPRKGIGLRLLRPA